MQTRFLYFFVLYILGGEFLFSPIKVLCPKKWRVVLMKTTCRFMESDGSFLMHDGMDKKD